MNKHDIQLLYEYNRWANARILGAAAQLTEEQYLAPGEFPHGGLRGTLVHVLFGEWMWRRRWPTWSIMERSIVPRPRRYSSSWASPLATLI